MLCSRSVKGRLRDAASFWISACSFIKPDDWVFASKRYRG
jgi:hypothetical protein